MKSPATVLSKAKKFCDQGNFKHALWCAFRKSQEKNETVRSMNSKDTAGECFLENTGSRVAAMILQRP